MEPSVRVKGLKRGGKMILAGLILVPLLGILTEFFRLPQVFVGLAALMTFWGGILRMIYALIFEGGEKETLEEKFARMRGKIKNRENESQFLPPQQSNPVSGYAPPNVGSWRETGEFTRQNRN
ncbi:MAG: hypothetical protein R2747_04215 [Pyrinomonadaceae bacterium]